MLTQQTVKKIVRNFANDIQRQGIYLHSRLF